MNIALWIVQVLLALAFGMAGAMKAFQYEKAKASLPWVKEVSKEQVNFIGISELLGALGLILPMPVANMIYVGKTIVPLLTPLAAIGLAIIMVLAAIFHYKRDEKQVIVVNVVLLALALFVAIGRLFFVA
jgi:uncharacterized membrane protein